MRASRRGFCPPLHALRFLEAEPHPRMPSHSHRPSISSHPISFPVARMAGMTGAFLVRNADITRYKRWVPPLGGGQVAVQGREVKRTGPQAHSHGMRHLFSRFLVASRMRCRPPKPRCGCIAGDPSRARWARASRATQRRCVRYSAVRCSAVPCSAVQYSALQCSAVSWHRGTQWVCRGGRLASQGRLAAAVQSGMRRVDQTGHAHSWGAPLSRL